MRAKVFVIQDVPGKNILPAKEFGDIHVLLNGHETMEVAIMKLTERLQEITSTDYLLMIGDPAYILIAGFIALTNCEGNLNVLRWDRDHYRYNSENLRVC